MTPKELRALRVLAEQILSNGDPHFLTNPRDSNHYKLNETWVKQVSPALVIKLLDLITDLKHPPKEPPTYTNHELSQRRLRCDDEATVDRQEQRQRQNDHA